MHTIVARVGELGGTLSIGMRHIGSEIVLHRHISLFSIDSHRDFLERISIPIESDRQPEFFACIVTSDFYWVVIIVVVILIILVGTILVKLVV